MATASDSIGAGALAPFAVCRRKPSVGGTAALLFEEVSQQRAAFLRHDPSPYLRAVIEPRVTQQVVDRSCHPRLFVPGPKDDPTHLREHDRAGALGARLQRDVERCAGKPIFAGVGEGALDREKLGMGGGVPARDRLVMGLAQNTPSALQQRRPVLLLRFRRPASRAHAPARRLGPERRLTHSRPGARPSRVKRSAPPCRSTMTVSPSP